MAPDPRSFLDLPQTQKGLEFWKNSFLCCPFMEGDAGASSGNLRFPFNHEEELTLPLLKLEQWLYFHVGLVEGRGPASGIARPRRELGFKRGLSTQLALPLPDAAGACNMDLQTQTSGPSFAPSNTCSLWNCGASYFLAQVALAPKESVRNPGENTGGNICLAIPQTLISINYVFSNS